jgi:hypothetical protein
MAFAMRGSLQDTLPAELVLLVTEHLAGDNVTLCALARTSRWLQSLAEEQIYKTIELDSVQDLQRIVQAFARRQERARVVHTLKLQYQLQLEHLNSSVEMREQFNKGVAHMVHLREFLIESPYDNFGWDKDLDGSMQWVESDMASFESVLERACTEGPAEGSRILQERRLGNNVERTVGLALLERLTIHTHGANSDFWPLDGFHCLFRHPSLRFLHVSCVEMPAELPELDNLTTKTPLTTLVFDECDLRPNSLRSILSAPAKLKHLTLGENVFNVHHSKRVRPRLSRNAAVTLDALSMVAHSLESLTHHDPSWRLDSEPSRSQRTRPSGDGLRDFHALKTIQCDTSSFLHQVVIMNHEMAPPNLETLRLCRHWEVEVDFFDHAPEVETYLALPSLTTLELIQAAWLWDIIGTPGYVCEAERLRNRHAYAYKLFKAGINLKLLIELHKGRGLIPPYLHGEIAPRVECLYDASEVGFRRHVNHHVYDGDAAREEDSFWGKHIYPLGGGFVGVIERNALLAGGSKELQPSSLVTSAAVPETDQLGDGDLDIIMRSTTRTLMIVKNILNHLDDSDVEDIDEEDWETDDGNMDMYLEVWHSEDDDDYDDDDQVGLGDFAEELGEDSDLD